MSIIKNSNAKMTKQESDTSKVLFAKVDRGRITDDQRNFLGQIDENFIYIFSRKRKELFALKREILEDYLFCEKITGGMNRPKT